MRPASVTPKYLFIREILQALHIEYRNFGDLALDRYDLLIYYWIAKLYDKGKSKDDTLKLIFKARNVHLLKSSS